MNIFLNLKKGKWIKIDLDKESRKAGLDFSDAQVCLKWIQEFHKKNNAQYSFGGFLEDRTYLWRNHPNEKAESLIHLGIDYSVPAGTEVFLPKKGKVFHIMKDPHNDIGWGGRIIFALDDGNYLLFGHLKQNINLKLGQICNEGEKIGEIGQVNENGNWWPHLHVQLMNQNFVDSYSSDLEELNGYLSKDDSNIHNVIDPAKIINLS